MSDGAISNNHTTASNRLAGCSLMISIFALAIAAMALYFEYRSTRAATVTFRPQLNLKDTHISYQSDKVTITTTLSNDGRNNAVIHKLEVAIGPNHSLPFVVDDARGSIIHPGASREFTLVIDRIHKISSPEVFVDVVRTLRDNGKVSTEIQFASEELPEEMFNGSYSTSIKLANEDATKPK